MNTSSSSQRFFDSIRRSGIVRSEDRWIGGVSGGIARRFDIDPLIVRGILIALAIVGGSGLLLYGLAWLLLPDAQGRICAEGTPDGVRVPGLAGAITLTVIGAFATFFGAGISSGLSVLVLIGVAVVVAMTMNRPHPHNPLPQQQPAPTPQPADGQPSGAVPPPAPQSPPTSQPTPSSDPGSVQDSDPSSAPTQEHDGTGGNGEDTQVLGNNPTVTQPYASAAPATQPIPDYSQRSGYPAGGYSASEHSQRGYSYSGYSYPGYQAPGGPEAAPTPVVKGPGATMISVVAALSLFVIAGVLVAYRLDAGLSWSGSLLLATGSVAAVIGLGMAITALRGRRGGALHLFAWMALFAGFVATPVAWAGNDWFENGEPFSAESSYYFGEYDFTPTGRAQAEGGLQSGLGQMNVNLTRLGKGTTSNPITVPVSHKMGSMKLVLPADTTVQVNVNGRWSSVNYDLPKNRFENIAPYSSGDFDRTITTGPKNAKPTMIVNAYITAGELEITQEH